MIYILNVKKEFIEEQWDKYLRNCRFIFGWKTIFFSFFLENPRRAICYAFNIFGAGCKILKELL